MRNEIAKLLTNAGHINLEYIFEKLQIRFDYQKINIIYKMLKCALFCMF